jgi:hypothetical protein
MVGQRTAAVVGGWPWPTCYDVNWGGLEKCCVKPRPTKMARGKLFNPTKFAPIENCSRLAPNIAHVRACQVNNFDVTSIYDCLSFKARAGTRGHLLVSLRV